DVQQMLEIENLQTFYRGNDPTPIRDVTLTGMNVPCRIGNAICLPGDVVLGTPAGVIFIPPHLAEEVCIRSEKLRLKEMFGMQRVREGIYRTDQVDRAWTPEMEAAFAEWRKENTPPEFQHLVWDEPPPVPKKEEGPTLL
ncbi:MAG: RraA family protein, partial [Armatimonadota bacterium]|nr:RraA family protein [Armatimonadota bacterium]